MKRAVLAALLACSPLAAAGPEFLRIPAGSFVMGCEPKNTCPELQEPRKVVFERAFRLHRTEVTVGDFREFVKATGHQTQAEKSGQPWTWQRPRAYKLDPRQPVMYVALKDAEAYCAWSGARLPTEPEWTYAFRAGETIRGHLWWDTDGRYVWFRENSDYRPHPVGTRLPNAWGLHDMEGNAWEWTRTVAPEKYPAAIRGGSWIVCPVIAGGPRRPDDQPKASYGTPFTRCLSDGVVHVRDDIGFRCARSEP